MQRYGDFGGKSNVIGFEISQSSIIVEFSGGSQYLYNYEKPGINKVEKMKSLALAGKGLNSYISLYIKKDYAAKLR